MPNFIIRKIRFFILAFSFALALAIFIYVRLSFNSNIQTIRLTQIYALTSLIYLYFALLASPLFSAFPNLTFRPVYILARRALGVSAFLFAALHASFAFFGQLQGFSGLAFLSRNYLIAISLSTGAILILFLLTITSTDKAIKVLGNKKWKNLHRLVYLAGLAVLIHALMLGTHFANLSRLIPQISSVAISLLLILEAHRLDKYLSSKSRLKAIFLPRFGAVFCLTAIGVGLIAIFTTTSDTENTSLGIHAQHQQIAADLLSGKTSTSSNVKIPGLIGDRTLRYNVQLTTVPDKKNPLKNTLTFSVNNAASGEPASLFQIINEKISHLIIVDSSLSYFDHIHPDQKNNQFIIETTFPKPDNYHLYIDFQPLGAIEQQFAFTLNPTASSQIETSTQAVDTTRTKNFGNYQVSLTAPDNLNINDLSLGKTTLAFTIKNVSDLTPVTDLKPYLGSFGHLVMINQKTYEYYHVHPSNLTPPLPDQNGGPTIEFLPIGLYGPFKQGSYRVFGQFNHNGKILVADFTINVK